MHGPEAAIDALDVAQHMEALLSVYLQQSEFSQIKVGQKLMFLFLSLLQLCNCCRLLKKVRGRRLAPFNIAAAFV